MKPNVTAAESYLRLLKDQDEKLRASSCTEVPTQVSITLKRLFDEINQAVPNLKLEFQGHGKAVVLRSQLSTAIEKLTAHTSDLESRSLREGEAIDREQLLAEIEDVLRTVPPRATIRHDTEENFGWFGRAAAAIESWDRLKSPLFSLALSRFHSQMASTSTEGFRQIMVMLHQAQNDLRMRTLGPMNIAVGKGRVFEYFDELRKAIELASNEVLFVDPYLDAEFVSRYLPMVKAGVIIRLLTSEKKLATLLPAIEPFCQQTGQQVSVRSTATGLHDRYAFIDKRSCFQSGRFVQRWRKTGGNDVEPDYRRIRSRISNLRGDLGGGEGPQVNGPFRAVPYHHPGFENHKGTRVSGDPHERVVADPWKCLRSPPGR